MSPAFSNIKQAIIFATLLGLAMVAPLIIRGSWLPPREQVYSSLGWDTGSFPYLHDEIFEQKAPVDIAFMGTSRVWWGINTPEIQNELRKKVGEGAIARTFSWNWPGFDRFYYVLRDVLEHRSIRMIVFPNCLDGARAAAHPRAPGFFRFETDDNSRENLNIYSKTSFYVSAMLGLPRNLLGLFRPNESLIPSPVISWAGFSNMASPFLNLGSLPITRRLDQPFVVYRPTVPFPSSAVCVYSDDTKSIFQFSNQPISQLQVHYARKIGDLARRNHIKLVYLHIPLSSDSDSPIVTEPEYWPEIFGTDVTMVGIPSAKFFAGIPPADVLKLYFNPEHLNKNGQEFFTSVVAPTLVQIYENQTKH